MEQEGHRVLKLATDGANWDIYPDRLIWAMQANSIDEHITADTPSPEYTALGMIDNLTPEARWTKEENQIKQVLCTTLPDMAFNRIKNASSIKDAWETLKRVYEERSKALLADVIRRFRNKRCEETESVHSHFESLADLREQLAAMGKAVDDTDYTDTLLASLPASYDSTVSSISASARLGSNTLTAEISEQLVIDEYERRKVKDKRDKSKDEAVTAAPTKKSGKRDKRNVECFDCHKKGTSPSVGQRVVVMRATDPSGEKAQRKMQPQLRRRRSQRHGPRSRMRRSSLTSLGPTTLLLLQGVSQRGQSKQAHTP